MQYDGLTSNPSAEFARWYDRATRVASRYVQWVAYMVTNGRASIRDYFSATREREVVARLAMKYYLRGGDDDLLSEVAEDRPQYYFDLLEEREDGVPDFGLPDYKQAVEEGLEPRPPRFLSAAPGAIFRLACGKDIYGITPTVYRYRSGCVGYSVKMDSGEWLNALRLSKDRVSWRKYIGGRIIDSGMVRRYIAGSKASFVAE